MRSKALLVANILATVYAVYLFYYFGNSILNADGAAAIGGAIAAVLVAPHMFSFLIGAVFGWVGYGQRKIWGALTAAILYTVGTVMFLTYFMFGVPILILGFIGYANQKKCNAEYELQQLEQAEIAKIVKESGNPENIIINGKRPAGIVLDESVPQPIVENKPRKANKKADAIAVVAAIAVYLLAACVYIAVEDHKKVEAASSSSASTTTTSTANKTTSNSSTANKTTTTTTPKTETKKEPETIVFEAEFTDGNYTAGIDFPAGRYTITAIAGTGNVSSSNRYDGGLSEIMGVEDDDVKEFKNARFDDDVILKVKNGVTIKIHSDKADATPLKKRVQPNTETVRFTSGYYISGEDFPAGVYDVVAIEGTGNVSSDNMWDGGINAAVGITDGLWADLYSKEYKNIELPEGVELEVSGGLTVDLVPSK